MFSKVMFLATVLALVLLFVAGLACNDEEGGGAENPDQTMAQATLDEVGTPLVQALNLAQIVGEVGATPTSALDDCQPVDFCTSGSADACSNVAGVEVTFTDCMINGSVVNGSIHFDGDELAGTATLDVTIDDTRLQGAVLYEDNGTCFRVDYPDTCLAHCPQVSITSPNLSGSIAGYVEYCDPPVVLDGVVVPSTAMLQLFLPDRVVDLEIYNSFVDGEVIVSVWNSDETEIFLICTGILFESFSCFLPES